MWEWRSGLGVETGDMIALEPRFTMSNGYIKSRFVDDKACAAVLLNVMKALAENEGIPEELKFSAKRIDQYTYLEENLISLDDIGKEII